MIQSVPSCLFRNLLLALMLSPTLAMAQTAQTDREAPESLKVYFASGSAAIGGDQADVLDTAARLFREGSPYVMILSGGADTVGAPERNLDLSVRRARSVAEGLTDRGIPIERLQLLGRGNSDLEVSTGEEVDNRENRVVEITWR